MTKNQVRTRIKTMALSGKSKEQIFDELSQVSQLPEETLAKLVKNVASLDNRKKCKAANIVLIILVVFSIITKILLGISIVVENGTQWIPVIIFLPMINVLLLTDVTQPLNFLSGHSVPRKRL